MSIAKSESSYVITALSFLTIIPIRQNYKIDNYKKAAFYFPVVGHVIGIISAFSLIVLSLIFPTDIAVLIAGIIVPIVITGGLHKDAIADFFDGFCASKNKEDILRIMKDSSIGAYGVVAIVLFVLIQYLALLNISLINTYTLALSLILANSTSRLLAISFMYTHQYARDTATNNKGQIWSLSKKELILSSVLTVVPVIILFKLMGIIIIIVQIILWLYLSRLFNKKINGYTGDTLGAAIEMSETLFYLTILTTSTL